MDNINKKNLVIYNPVICKRSEVKNKRYFNQQISKYKFELILKLITNKYYKDSFFNLLFFPFSRFCLQYLLILFTY